MDTRTTSLLGSLSLLLGFTEASYYCPHENQTVQKSTLYINTSNATQRTKTQHQNKRQTVFVVVPRFQFNLKKIQQKQTKSSQTKIRTHTKTHRKIRQKKSETKHPNLFNSPNQNQKARPAECGRHGGPLDHVADPALEPGQNSSKNCHRFRSWDQKQYCTYIYIYRMFIVDLYSDVFDCFCMMFWRLVVFPCFSINKNCFTTVLFFVLYINLIKFEYIINSNELFLSTKTHCHCQQPRKAKESTEVVCWSKSKYIYINIMCIYIHINTYTRTYHNQIAMELVLHLFAKHQHQTNNAFWRTKPWLYS